MVGMPASGLVDTDTFNDPGAIDNHAMQPNESTRKLNFLDVLNAVGSLASITGISLLYLKGEGALSVSDMIGIGLIASCSLGLVALILWTFIRGYRRFMVAAPLMLRVAYFTLGVPAAILFGVVVALLANKAFISVDWSWFFHQR
ncbi:hypothetical protein CKY39_08655 [Variovorax boronicumulans]|uniref:Uncharacterized protein n=2 Tax=Variovorax boronicumulans TaxID=436515 RepID=A0A250DGA3_9BURK|nr:hypothetical protein CKY39_08655 [Variovorax boronicumulans]